MATTLFLLDEMADTHRGTNTAKRNGSTSGWHPLALSTSRGDIGVRTDRVTTVTGPTNGIEIEWTSAPATLPIEWLSPPVSADVTISGTITANIWAQESGMNANAAINVIIDIVRATTSGADASNTITNIVQSTRTTELGFSGANTVQNFTTGMTSGAYTGQTVNRGDRIRIRVVADDAGTMGSGFTVTIGYDGPTGAVDGDTFVTFTETFSFESAPGGSVVYFTDTRLDTGLTTPTLLDDFNRANVDPIDGNWSTLDTPTGTLKIVSNQVQNTTAGAASGAAYWNAATFGPDLEAYYTMAVTPSASVSYEIMSRIQSPGGSGVWDGYSIDITNNVLSVLIWTNATPTTLAGATVSATPAAGDKVGMRIYGSTIEAWMYDASAATWLFVATATDTTYASAGNVGMGMFNSDGGIIDDFFVGALGSTPIPGGTRRAWTSRGGSAVTNVRQTVSGYTIPLQITEASGGAVTQWFTPQLQAVTLEGLATANLRVASSSTTARESFRCEIARVDSNGSNASVWASWLITQSNVNAFGGEIVDPTETAYTANVSGDSLSISQGQRLRVRLYLDDSAGSALVTGQTLTFWYAGTSGGATGDSFITFPVTLTEFVATVETRDPWLPSLDAVRHSNTW